MAAENDFNLEEDRFKKLVANPRFQTRVLNLRKKYDIPKDGFKDNASEYAKKEEYSEATLQEIRRGLRKVVTDFKLSERWYEGLRIYLFNNNPFMLRVQSPYVLKFEHDDVTKWEKRRPKEYHTVWIGVDAETNEEEIREALKAAKDYLPKRNAYRPAYNASQVIEGRQLREQGLSWDEVADKVNRKFKSNYNSESMRIAVSRLK